MLDQVPDFNLDEVRITAFFCRIVARSSAILVDVKGVLGPDLKLSDVASSRRVRKS